MKHGLVIYETDFGIVRTARPGDTGRLIEMIESLARHHADTATLTSSHIARDVFGTPPWLRVLVAEAEGGLIGYAALCPQIQLQLGRRGLDIHHLFVTPEHRGRGVGRQVVMASAHFAQSLHCSTLTVSTHPDNHGAQVFYETLGFVRKTGQAPRFTMPIPE